MYFFFSTIQKNSRKNKKENEEKPKEKKIVSNNLNEQESIIRKNLERLINETKIIKQNKEFFSGFETKNKLYMDPELYNYTYSIDEILNNLIKENKKNEQNENFRRDNKISKLPEFKYKYSNKHMKRIDKICAICLNEFKENDRVKMFSCEQHIFHKDCILKWLNNNDICPLCKKSIKY